MKLWIPIATAAVLALASDAVAHHSTAYFLKEKMTKVQGRVTRVEWRSPHTTIFVETKEPSGQLVQWRIETNYTALLVREGWSKDSLKPGDQVSADVFPVADPNARYAWLLIATKADGTVLRTGQSSLRQQVGNLPDAAEK